MTDLQKVSFWRPYMGMKLLSFLKDLRNNQSCGYGIISGVVLKCCSPAIEKYVGSAAPVNYNFPPLCLKNTQVFVEVSSEQQSCGDWFRGTITSGWKSIWKGSSVGSWFSLLGIRDVSGSNPEWTRTCRSRRNSSSLKTAAEMRLSVLLNSWDNFFVTLPSIVSDTWVVSSSGNLRKFVYHAWLFLGCISWFSWLTAANLLLIFRDVIFRSGKITNSVEDWINFYRYINSKTGY